MFVHVNYACTEVLISNHKMPTITSWKLTLLRHFAEAILRRREGIKNVL